MRLKRFTFKLRPETTLGQIWEAIREWIEGSPYSRFKGLRILPTKITEGEFDWESKEDRVTLSRVSEGMRVGSERTRRGLRWRTELAFERGKKAVKCVVEMHIVGSIPEADIEVKEPMIVKRLKRVYGEEEISRVEVEKCRGKVEKVGGGGGKKRPKVKRGMRVEKSDNIAALVKVLRTHAFEMLKMDRDGQLRLMKTTCGKSLAKEAGVREKSVGKLIDLKWRKHVKPAETLQQLLYIICTDDTVFRFFESAAKGARAIWEKKSNEELYALIKGVFKSVGFSATR